MRNQSLPRMVWMASLTVASAAQAVNLPSLINRADAVVVASISPVERSGTAASASLKIERALKGQVSSPITVVVGPIRAGAYQVVPQLKAECGLWFLIPEGNGKWRPVSTAFDSTYFPLAECSPAGSGQFAAAPAAPLLDKIALELASAAEAFNGQRGYSAKLYTMLVGTNSETRRQVAARFSVAANPDLLALGLALGIGLQEPAALGRLEAEAAVFARSNGRSGIYGAIASYTNAAPSGIEVLGRIATQQSSPATTVFAAAAAEALKNIHTRETLPYLVQMLDNSDPTIRERAVAGFSIYRLGVPPGLPEAERIRQTEAKMNPGTSDLKAQDLEYVHLGRFRDAAEEADYRAYYKRWWVENRGRLGM